MAAMFVNRSKRNEQSYQRTFNRRFLPSFGSFGLAVSEKIFRNRPTRNKNCLWRTCLLTDRNEMSNLKRGRRTPSDGKSSHWLWQGKLKTTLYIEMSEGMGHQILTATEKVWRVGQGQNNQSFVVAIIGLLFLKSTKAVFSVKGSWHSPNTLLTYSTMVHCQALCDIT